LGRHANELEAALGVTLFIRSPSGMRLTEAGLSLLEEARLMQAEADRLMIKAAGHDTRVKGTVRLTASQIVATYYLPPILVDLKSTEPDIEIELVATNSIANLLARDADIAIRMVRPTQNDVIASKVKDITIGAFAHESYLARTGMPLGFGDLVRHVLIGYDRDDFALKAMQQMGVEGDRSWFHFRTDDQVAGWELMKAGAGIGFGPAYLASITPGLVHVLPWLEFPTLPMWLAAHQDLRTSRRVRKVMDFLQDALKAMPFDMPLSGFEGRA
jgi:DNA-binding transcriptional LysR family regulator